MTTVTVCNFTFTPQGFTARDWDNRAFKQAPSSTDELFRILKEYEKKLGFGKYLSGFIYYKNGFFSEYEDGTHSTKPWPQANWWETEMRACHKGCCTKMPSNWDPETRTYAKEDWQKGKFTTKGGWNWCICQKEKHPEGPFINDTCPGHPRSEPVPLKSYWTKPAPRKQNWQEFRRIPGMGGAEDQFKQIKRKEEVERISLIGLGYFTVNAVTETR